jgi:predicted nucleic acid-binding protein
MLVVDTNVVASLLLNGPFSEQARARYAADPDWRSEAFLMTELANVLALQVKLRDMPLPDALNLLSRADALMADGLVEIPHGAALTLATRLGVSAYDARYLVVAQRLQTRLVTEDAKLRSKAPDLTCSLAEALAR